MPKFVDLCKKFHIFSNILSTRENVFVHHPISQHNFNYCVASALSIFVYICVIVLTQCKLIVVFQFVL